MSVLLPYQADFYEDPAKLRVCEKSRRIGITYSEAARQVMLAARGRGQGGMDCYYLSTSQRLGRKYIALCARWAKDLNLAAEALGTTMLRDAGRDILVNELRFASGHTVQALASNPEAMRGEGGDVIIDEGAHHQHLDELLKAAWALGDWDGGRITVISTHNGKDNPFNTLCEEIRAKKRRGSLHRVTIHDALAMGLFRRRCEVRDQPYTRQAEEAWLADTLASWGAEEEYLVIPSSSGGVYIRSDLIEECSIGGRIVRLELPDAHMHLPEGERAAIIAAWCEAELGPLLRMLPAARTTLGYDFARSGQGDLSVMAPMFEQQDMVKVCPWLVELRGVPYREQWTIFEFVAGRLGKWFAGAAIDAGGNGNWLGEQALTKYGASLISALHLSADWYSNNMPRFRSAFEEAQIVVPADVDVRDDLLMFRLNARGVPTLGDYRRRDSKDRKPRHGDAAIALVLAHSRHRDAPQAMEYRRVERWPSSTGEKRARLRRHQL